MRHRRKEPAGRIACSRAKTRSHQQLPSSDEDGLAAHTDPVDGVTAAIDPDVNATAPAHGHSLKADHPLHRITIDETVADEVTAERTRGTACRRVFDDAKFGSEHPTVHSLCRAPWLDGEEEDRDVQPGRRHESTERGRVTDRAVHRLPIAKRHEKIGDAARDLLHRKVFREIAVESSDIYKAPRVDLKTPEASLILAVPSTKGMPQVHPVTSFASSTDADYQLILVWIKEGAKQN